MNRISRLSLSILLFALPLAPLPARGAVKRMFVTSIAGSTKLSLWPQAQGAVGLAAGDQICRTLAEDASLPNFASYRAWLSNATSDAYCRVAGFSEKKATNCGQSSLPDAGPWQRVDGKPFARSLSQLTAELALLHPPLVNELGGLASAGTTVHSGTEADGTVYSDFHCNGWTSDTVGNERFGYLPTGTSMWSSYGQSACGAASKPLYCFEPGIGDPLPQFEAPGALVFLSSVYGTGDLGNWNVAGAATGLAAGDAICRSLAETAALPSPQSFVAWLSNDAVDAIDRVTTNGPFKRIDGVEIAASKSELVVASIGDYAIETAIVVDEHGEYSGNLGQASWTGSDHLGERVLETCAGWTSADGADDGRCGLPYSVRGYWTSSTPAPVCSSQRRLYCFSNSITIFWDGFESSTTDRWSATVL